MEGVPESPNGARSVWWPYLYSAGAPLLLTWEWEIQAGSSFIWPTGHPWFLPSVLSLPARWPNVAQLMRLARQKISSSVSPPLPWSQALSCLLKGFEAHVTVRVWCWSGDGHMLVSHLTYFTPESKWRWILSSCLCPLHDEIDGVQWF